MEYRDEARACVVRMDGELDLQSVPRVKEGIVTALERGCVNVVLDLSRVSYADSSSFSLLVWLDRELMPRAGKLVLAGADGNVSRVLELSGLIGAAPTIAASLDVSTALSGLDRSDAQATPLWRERMSLPASAATLAEIRTSVCDVLAPLCISEGTMFDIRVAVGEALANAIRHGSPRGASDSISIEVTAYPDRVSIQVTDSGNGFDGSTLRSEDLYASSGRGVMFMRALMDTVEFASCTDGGTAVTLVKHVGSRQV
jgi:anti-anti-sigma factor